MGNGTNNLNFKEKKRKSLKIPIVHYKLPTTKFLWYAKKLTDKFLHLYNHLYVYTDNFENLSRYIEIP